MGVTFNLHVPDYIRCSRWGNHNCDHDEHDVGVFCFVDDNSIG